ncbi:acyl-CoA/acyl-ACP dehydrogenase [Aldersonia sp. NBC_00410]|uniref:acyl-CoA dehydrogenase family protein n=1 Tax=Aldersonia sp. NBC_00410 TaxID=2975954 RepID=UPI002259DA6C|nr:acyl-CoA dehydrogenase family protein [Aldersonia sp. NBC_00410]MCX5043320.1 acyl-CoA/acyl-ACP dehydrogenase [Aldersonia sp. NBC_00410]
MKFALSSEQKDFAASLRDLLNGAKTPSIARAWAEGDTADGRKLLTQLADTGLTALAVDEQFGGIGAHPVDLVVAFTEIGRAAVPGPLVETAAAIPALLQSLDNDEAAQRFLPALAEGTSLGTVTLGDWLPRALDAAQADVVLIAEGDRIAVGEVGAQFDSVDATRKLNAIAVGEVVAEGPAVARATARALDAGNLAVAAQLLGAGRAVTDLSTEYVGGRVQFGKKIGSFQAVKHHLANSMIGLEMALPLLYGAAIALAEDSPTASRDVSAAKVAGADAAERAARAALQVHGAIGYTAEYDLSLWLTKIRALRSAWGTTAQHRARVAESLRSAR